MSAPAKGVPAPPPRRTGSAIVFAVLLVAGVAGAFLYSPATDVALSAGAAWLVFLLLVVSIWDLGVMAGLLRRYLAWLPEWPLRGWLEPVRASFVMVAFFYGIVVGHFFWK